MGLSALDAALSGLRVSQQQLSVISNNVANVSTPGFTRKILPQSSQAINGVGVGVLSETIIRNVDLNLSRDLWTQVSATSELEVQQKYLERVEQFHGPPDAELSIAAELSRLKDSFSALSNSPGDRFLQSAGVNQALDMASKINDFSALLQTSRNDAQEEIRLAVESINDLLVQISELNADIRSSLSIGRTVAQLEDERDNAIKELSEFIEITQFKRGDGVLVVQTKQGEEIASERAATLFFQPTQLSPTVAYPDSSNPNINGIFVRNPNEDTSALDITQQNIGGKLGGLIEVRDNIFPRQQAQLDEMAHKLALRFDAQGLRLFTNAAGGIPDDTPPDPTAGPPPTGVEYIGFADEIQVNQLIVDDPSLLQQGTYGASLPTGSNEVLRRVVEFTFGDINFQQAANPTLAEAIDLANAGIEPLRTYLGLQPENSVNGAEDLTAYPSVNDMINTLGTSVFGTSPGGELDEFQIAFGPDFGNPVRTVIVDLRDLVTAAPAGANAAEQLVNYIQADPNWVNIVNDYAGSVSVGPDGQLQFTATTDITIAAGPGPDALSVAGFSALGLSPTTFTAQDPYFDVQVGNNDPARITITPTTTAADLLAALNAVEGLVARFDPAEGFLEVRPGNDFTTPDFGGDIKFTSGPFATTAPNNYSSGTGNTRAALDTGVNIISALFGSYSITGGSVNNVSPVQNVGYGSQVSATDTTLVPFRTQFLGVNTDVSTDIIGSNRLIDYSQKMVNQQTQDLNLTKARIEDQQSLRDILETRLNNESGVNLDEELSRMIVVQTAFSASARVVEAVDNLFQELINAVR